MPEIVRGLSSLSKLKYGNAAGAGSKYCTRESQKTTPLQECPPDLIQNMQIRCIARRIYAIICETSRQQCMQELLITPQ
jgi:hypothetical protein